MQVDLTNSEAVQRDFVKLSQSLQVGTSVSRECGLMHPKSELDQRDIDSLHIFFAFFSYIFLQFYLITQV